MGNDDDDAFASRLGYGFPLAVRKITFASLSLFMQRHSNSCCCSFLNWPPKLIHAHISHHLLMYSAGLSVS